MNPIEYAKLNEMLSEFSRLSAALEAAEAEIKTVQLAAAAGLLPSHAQCKVKLTDLEGGLRDFCAKHYDELFPEAKRTHSTPFGDVQYRRGTSIVVDDEDKTILRIQGACFMEGDLSRTEHRSPRFTLDQLTRVRRELNLEALGALDDSLLTLFGAVRKTEDKFSVKPFDMRSDKPAKASKSAKSKLP
jgi:phage host-nuclease inhibitor protein Gam